MTTIQQINGTISAIKDLSATAREYTIVPATPLPFVAGAFVNLFIEHDGKTIRRAFSMSSSDTNDQSFTLTIRLSLHGELTPILWDHDFQGKTVRLMGPLGLNTADKMSAPHAFLFGFGVGAGVVKSLADHLAAKPDLKTLTIVTGNRSIDEILHKDYFDELAKNNPKVTVTYVVSDKTQSQYPTGYIQEHIGAYDFNNADVYMCGQKVACDALTETVSAKAPKNCTFFVEDFH